MGWPGPGWFRDLTGLDDDRAGAVQTGVAEAGGAVLVARATGRRMQAGSLHLPSLAALRAATPGFGLRGQRPLPIDDLRGDAIALHCDPAHAGAVFQVASQFSLLEMPGPGVSPDAGVARYWRDRTQGPARAMACGAGLLWRAYFVPLDEQRGQTAGGQIDALADLGRALGNDAGRWWRMRNGYALGAGEGIAALSARIAALDEAARDRLRGALREGVQAGTEVTLAPGGHRVTQVLASALPVACAPDPEADWEPFARLVLEAAHEATLRAALLHAGPARPVHVFLTRLGGGAFGNDPRWIGDAIDRALEAVSGAPPCAMLVTHGRGGAFTAGSRRASPSATSRCRRLNRGRRLAAQRDGRTRVPRRRPSRSAPRSVAGRAHIRGKGRLEGGLLLGRGLALVAGAPRVVGHAVDRFARRILVHLHAAGVGLFLIPARETVAAEAGEGHQVDVLHIGPVLHQMPDEPAEHGCLDGDLGVRVHHILPPLLPR